MADVTTAQILAEKALQESCGQQCVDWAICMLGRGFDGYFLTRLSGMLPPHNHFEILDLRDRALSELGIDDMSLADAVTEYAVELFRSTIEGDKDILSVLAVVNDLCIASDYQCDIMDFYLLYNAYDDLQSQDVQWYWDGATKENVSSIIRERVAAFVERHTI